ncbi:PREDICTED: pentatricopeptide repeat-containing protein At3g56550 [Tarenaya hassleriana]|uniref:pentatricopeptide repeat-containing protein At3g56550 n=1 Tax=Tarenaya hassleriana TaxID=28532 RepID=UPI00053C8595|nr:PREDICTED: pentatricopeptide repeat-containing protein At3g56550 [Tarenaya hassleriana]
MSEKAKAILRLLQGCNGMNRLRKIHTHVFINGLQNDPSLLDKLLNFCAVSVSGSLSYALLLFNGIQNPSTQAWNSIIRGFALSSSPLSSLLFYNRMLVSSISQPDIFTFTFALKACEILHAVPKSLELHASIIRHGFASDAVVCTNLIRCYAANGRIEAASMVFDEMPLKDLVSWNAMISCFSRAGLHNQALSMYIRMANEGIPVDTYTLVALLSSCSHVGALNMGIEMHRIAIDTNCESSIYVRNALIDMYAKCGSLKDAVSIFDGMQKRDVLTWNSIIAGHGVHGHGGKAIEFFRKMVSSGMKPNGITFLGLLSGCSHQGLVREGLEHFEMMTSQFNLKPGIKHYGCMVDLYGRSGQLDKALEMILTSSAPEDPVLWRTLLSSCKIHKNAEMGQVAMEKLVQLGAFNAGDCVLMASIYSATNDGKGVARMRKLIRRQGIETTPGWSWIEIDNEIHRFVVDDKTHPGSAEIYSGLREVISRAKLAGYEPEGSSNGVTTDSYDQSSGSEDSFHSEKLAIAYGLMRTPEGKRLQIVKNLRVCRDCHSFTKYVSKAFNREIVVRDRVRFHHFAGGLCSCRDYW